MHRRTCLTSGWWQSAARKTRNLISALALASASAWAQTAAPAPTPQTPSPPTLQAAFEAAWLRQPEAQALAARRDAARAQQQAAQSWTPEPVALEASGKTDRPHRNLGTRELELGVAIPLWLPGERGRSLALAEAEGRAIESRNTAARLRVAASVREAWWSWQRARVELRAAHEQLQNVQRIAADVGRRLKAGDLARADQHQADGAVAGAEAAVAQAQASLTAAWQLLQALTALQLPVAPGDLAGPDAEPEPAVAETSTGRIDSHAELLALQDRAAVADGAAALAATQSRASPELTIATTRDRGAFGEAAQQTVTVAVRMPFGAGPRHEARKASARAEALEVQALLAVERTRLMAERESTRARTEAARTQVAAAERRALLARETRGFFDKSFRLGETDLPTRLRIEADAADAERQAARARIELATAISAWRQALGLLPQ